MYWVCTRHADFQFTTSHGGRPHTFNYHRLGVYLSIHDLTRRSTTFDSEPEVIEGLSIHDLTRRST